MHMLQSICNLVNVNPNLFLWKVYFVFNCPLEDQLHITLFGPLDSNEEFIQLVVDEPVQVLHDVRVV
jgi:hypothetical protein